MSDLIGLVAGTVFYRQEYFAAAEKKTVKTRFGSSIVILKERWAYIPRHGLEDKKHLPPHTINHRANMSTLKELGVTEVIGINSSGSLRPSLGPGSVVLPNDYICLSGVPTIFDDIQQHITPRLSDSVREKLAAAAQAAGVHIVNGGIYWQNSGPRLETRAEIRLQANYADMVGMTLASEATIAQELGLEYASLCSVDNHAHGLSPSPLSVEEILANAAGNADKMLKILQAYLEL